MAEGGFLKKSLKLAFKIAVWGIGFGIGSELITEFLTYGMLHGPTELSQSLSYMSKEFTEPIMSWANDAIGGEAGLGWFKGLLKGVHEFFGITDTFNTASLAAGAGTGAAPGIVGAAQETLINGLK
jgi:hypothetical protein